jgi:YfiH family protein
MFEQGSDQIYRCTAFDRFGWQRHGFGTRAGNPVADVTLRQIHSAIVLNAHGLADRQMEGDALVTADANKRIGVRTADCVPLLLLDCKRKAVAAVHAGWRGTAAEVAAGTLRKMAADFGTEPGDVHAAIGPCIRVCCYEVGAEVAARFASEAIRGRNLDLPEANRRLLVRAGVGSENIFDSGLCTACQLEQFFSYRREPSNPGRLLSVIEICEESAIFGEWTDTQKHSGKAT